MYIQDDFSFHYKFSQENAFHKFSVMPERVEPVVQDLFYDLNLNDLCKFAYHQVKVVSQFLTEDVLKKFNFSEDFKANIANLTSKNDTIWSYLCDPFFDKAKEKSSIRFDYLCLGEYLSLSIKFLKQDCQQAQPYFPPEKEFIVPYLETIITLTKHVKEKFNLVSEIEYSFPAPKKKNSQKSFYSAHGLFRDVFTRDTKLKNLDNTSRLKK